MLPPFDLFVSTHQLLIWSPRGPHLSIPGLKLLGLPFFQFLNFSVTPALGASDENTLGKHPSFSLPANNIPGTISQPNRSHSLQLIVGVIGQPPFDVRHGSNSERPRQFTSLPPYRYAFSLLITCTRQVLSYKNKKGHSNRFLMGGPLRPFPRYCTPNGFNHRYQINPLPPCIHFITHRIQNARSQSG